MHGRVVSLLGSRVEIGDGKRFKKKTKMWYSIEMARTWFINITWQNNLFKLGPSLYFIFSSEPALFQSRGLAEVRKKQPEVEGS